nr:splicing factor U2af small subunit B-like [Tanacetum cinerariifolium]
MPLVSSREAGVEASTETMRFGDDDFIILLLYVDDMLIVGKNIGRIAQLKRDLSKSFAMKDLGPAKQILVTRIFRDRAVDSLMYAMVCTRPDLAHAVGVVSRFLSNPDKKHWEAVKWIFRYLRATEACKELLWLKRFLQELGFKQQGYDVLCDNQSAIHLAKNSMSPIIVDFSPVTYFREATCRQYEENLCNRGGYCNFTHLKKINKDLRRQLFRRRRRSRSRSRSPLRHRNHDDRPQGSGRGGSDRGGSGGYSERHSERSRWPRSRTPGRRSGRSRSPGGKRNRSPVREGSAERRAKIEQCDRPVSAAVPKVMVTRPRHAHSLNTKSNSTIRRHKTRSQSSKTSNSSPKVTAAKAQVVSIAKGKKGKMSMETKTSHSRP